MSGWWWVVLAGSWVPVVLWLHLAPSGRYWLGRWRLRSGYCPACNSSPPQPRCLVCEGSATYGKSGSQWRPAASAADEQLWRARWDLLRGVKVDVAVRTWELTTRNYWHLWRRDRLVGSVIRDNGGTWTAIPGDTFGTPVTGFRSAAAAVMAALSGGGTR